MSPKCLIKLKYAPALAFLLAALVACSGSEEGVCEPERQVACDCPGAVSGGTHTCLSDGSGWGPCNCDDSSDPSEPDSVDDPSTPDSSDESDATDPDPSSDPDPDPTTDTGPDDGLNFLSRVENTLVDSNGNQVRLTGINWFGFETSTYLPHGLWQRTHASMLGQIVEMGFNSIRLPWCNDMLRVTAAVDTVDPDLMGKTPLEAMDTIIETAGELGLKIILDNHSREVDGYVNEGLWYTDTVSDEQWVADWEMMAERYAGNDTVVAFDLNNEPHYEAAWGTGDNSVDWNRAAERCANAVHEINPDVLIIVEGVESVNGDYYWWGSNLKGIRTAPIAITHMDKLVYSAHEYGPEVYEQPWFRDGSFPGNMPGIWDEYFGFVMNENLGHVLIGEFGIRNADSNGGAMGVWFETFLQYMDNDYSWTFWCLNPNSADTGGILQDDWISPEQWKLDALEPFMAPMIP